MEGDAAGPKAVMAAEDKRLLDKISEISGMLMLHPSRSQLMSYRKDQSP